MSKYEVFPFPPEEKIVTLSAYERSSIGIPIGVSILVGFVLVIVFGGVAAALFGAVSNNAGPIGCLLGPVGAIVLTAVGSVLLKQSSIKSEEAKRTQLANEQERNRVIQEAQFLTNNLNALYSSTISISNELPKVLNEASSWVQKAEYEYKSNAFAPYWDAIEQSAIWLGEFNNNTKRISSNATTYYQQLSGRRHTFPTFPVTKQSLPDAFSVVNEFQRVTRLGKTNFHFSNIWEHRSTREAIVQGFRTLNDAVENLGYSIDASIKELQESISSDMARLLEEQIATRSSNEAGLAAIVSGQQQIIQSGEKHHKQIAGKMDKQTDLQDDMARGKRPTEPSAKDWLSKDR